MKRYKVYAGIDPGTNTGLALWHSDKLVFLTCTTVPIHRALEMVGKWAELYKDEGLFVIFEDARQRKWYGKGDTRAKLQGAGSVKRDCSIWEEFVTAKGIPFRAVPPVKGCTKMDAERFKRLTGWEWRTSNHARDAAMLVFGM